MYELYELWIDSIYSHKINCSTESLISRCFLHLLLLTFTSILVLRNVGFVHCNCMPSGKKTLNTGPVSRVPVMCKV